MHLLTSLGKGLVIILQQHIALRDFDLSGFKVLLQHRFQIIWTALSRLSLSAEHTLTLLLDGGYLPLEEEI